MPRLVVKKGEAQSTDHALGGACVVGRHATADFVLNDPVASRRHFRVFPESGGWVMEDLGSTNGTRVNGQRVPRHVLHDGDLIAIGETELLFVQKDLLGGGPRRRAAAPVPRRRRSR